MTSFTYWDPVHEQVYVEAKAEWLDNPADKHRVWNLYKNTPPPLGYDPQMIWRAGVEDPELGILKLTPWRIELWSIGQLMQGKPPQVWRP
jgi:general stress protein 26